MTRQARFWSTRGNIHSAHHFAGFQDNAPDAWSLPCEARSRLTPVSRIAHAVQRIRQWLSETLADSRVAEIEKITTRDVTKEQEEIAPEIKETPKQTPQQTIGKGAMPSKQSPPQQQQQQRRSGGIHI